MSCIMKFIKMQNHELLQQDLDQASKPFCSHGFNP